jgi:hypothetical protein
VPDEPFTPDVPLLPRVPDEPAVPELPAVPLLPFAPLVPALPAVPLLPDVPELVPPVPNDDVATNTVLLSLPPTHVYPVCTDAVKLVPDVRDCDTLNVPEAAIEPVKIGESIFILYKYN